MASNKIQYQWIPGMTFLYCFTDMRNMTFLPTFDLYIFSHYSFFFQLRHKHSQPMTPLDFGVCAHTNINHSHGSFCQNLPGNTKHQKGWTDPPGPPWQQQRRDLKGAAGPTQHHQPQVHSSMWLLMVKSYTNLVQGTTLPHEEPLGSICL